jgi:hypothetical protein
VVSSEKAGGCGESGAGFSVFSERRFRMPVLSRVARIRFPFAIKRLMTTTKKRVQKMNPTGFFDGGFGGSGALFFRVLGAAIVLL